MRAINLSFRKRSSEQSVKKSKNFFYITASPKSGSSFSSLVLSDVLNLPIVDLVYSHFREQDLYLPNLEKYKDQVTISKHHTLATAPNTELFQKYNISPIVLTRNLPDTIVSLREHIIKTMRWPHFHIPLGFEEWTLEKQYDYLVEFAVPWYIFFYVSWNQVNIDGSLKVKFIKYEDLNNNEVATISEILEFLDLSVSRVSIENSIQNVKRLSSNKNRINKGVNGRGREVLNDSQLEKIVHLTKFYSNIDFQSIL